MKVFPNHFTYIVLAIYLTAPIMAQTTTGNTETTFTSQFTSAFGTTFISELLDHYFLIAAILAFRYELWKIIKGSVLALFMISLLGIVIGAFLRSIVTPRIANVVDIVFFFLMAAKYFIEVYYYEETVVNDTEKGDKGRELDVLTAGLITPKGAEPTGGMREVDDGSFRGLVSRYEKIARNETMWLAFAMVFLAEWADKGQVAISLMAQSGPLSGTLLGALFGDFLCAIVATVFGAIFAKYFPNRQLTLIGGIVFLWLAVDFILWPEL